MRTALGTIAAIIVIVAIIVGGYLGGWWLREDAINRDSAINNDSYARQTALQEELIDKYGTVADIDVQLTTATDEQAGPLRAQRTAVLNQFCLAYSQYTGTVSLPDTVYAYAERECP